MSWLSKVGSCQKPWLYPLFPAECIILKEGEKEATERIIFYYSPLLTFLFICTCFLQILAMFLGAVPFLKQLIFTTDSPLFFFTDSCNILGYACLLHQIISCYLWLVVFLIASKLEHVNFAACVHQTHWQVSIERENKGKNSYSCYNMD